MSGFYTEANYENSIIELFRDMGYRYVYAPDIDRDFYSPLYETELIEALYRLNSNLPEDAIKEAMFKLKHYENGELVQKNSVFMDYLQHGIEVRYFVKGKEHYAIVYLVDYENPDNNSFVVANQWTFIENSNKRSDIILFLNGLPVVIIELKSPSREETDIDEAYCQLRNYMQEIPSMFIYNCICVLSDQLTSRAGTITSGEDRFMEWKTKDGNYENTKHAQFDTFFEGMFQRERLLDIIKNFICFSNEGLKQFKILAGYHQYFAVNKAIESTKHATVTDGKGGVFWHTQGSGKSLSMVFYAHLLQEALDSPTIVVLTDRNDLDNQLYGQFAKCKDFLRQEPMHAESRAHLKALLDGRQANGIIFTTMQKFEESEEALSERRNIIVMADEAHRGQYGLNESINKVTGEIKIGTARIIRNSLPNATYIGFTGTPISMRDRSTREVFGDYIDVYDMTQAVEDGATRPVFYESRVIKLKLDETTLRLIDTEYDIMANNADPEVIEKSKRELGKMEELLGNESTIDSLVNDILDHYENYREGMLTNEQVIEELLNLAKQIAAAKEEGQQLGLTADELAFYDALTKPQAIKDFYENEELIAITKELADTLRKNKTVDWQKRDSARAKMRMLIKKLLKRHKYPPEGMDDAVQTVMTQCELWTDTNDMRENEDDKGYRVDMSDKLLMVAKKQENGYGIKI